MAIQVNNVILRNLQEQVEKNKQDIAKHYEIDRVLSDWGIKVLGVVNSPSDIPEGIYEYGDAYGVRTGSGIIYYVWTRANINVGQEEDYWLDIGALSIIGPTGPQGLQGPQGIQGVRGSTWVSSTSAPATSQLGNNGDQWLDTSNGDVYQRNSNGWTRTGNIRGPQGIQGPTGPQGIQGIQGPTGAQGPKGDTGSSFTIGGLLQSTDNLPTPTAANRSVGYAVRNQDGVTYDLYVVVGIDNLQWVNMGRVEGVEGPQGPVGPQGPAGADIQIVTITGIPSTATQGTLTQEQVQTLLDHPGNYIQFFNENFYPQDVETDEGYIVYSHVGMFEGNTKIKTITLTIATGGWVLTETSLVSAPISIVNELPEANEENFEKGKIYTTGELLQYLSKVPLNEPNVANIYSTVATGGAGAVSYGNFIYFIIYGNASTLYKFDILNNVITSMSTTLTNNLTSFGMTIVGQHIYIVGGIIGTTYQNKILKLNINNAELVEVGQLNYSVSYPVVLSINTQLYIFGGRNSNGNNMNFWYTFDTTTNTKNQYSNDYVGSCQGGCVVGNKIYLVGGRVGYSSSSTSQNITVFDTSTNIFTLQSITLPEGLLHTSLIYEGDSVYIFGGSTTLGGSAGIDKQSIYRLNLNSNTISKLSAIIPQKTSLAGITKIKNNVYLVNGYNSNYIVKAEFGFNYSFKTISTQ